MKKIIHIFTFACLILIPLGCSNGEFIREEKVGFVESVGGSKGELMISAAASLTDVLNEIKPKFEDEHLDIVLTFNFGSSGKLAQMIRQGAPSDVFLSASGTDMDKLQSEALILEDTRSNFAENELVLITNKEQPTNLTSFEEISSANAKHFAIGEPESVPVGRYTKEVLEHLGLWGSLQGSLVLGSDVRQVLTHVEMGNAQIGVVYSSDAFISDRVKVIARANTEWHNPIFYPGAVVSDTSRPEAAKVFLEFLTSEVGQEILTNYGFK